MTRGRYVGSKGLLGLATLLAFALGAISISLAGTGKIPRCRGELATMIGTGGNDRINGTRDSDVIVGRRGNDDIDGRSGKDLICGGSGDDTLSGGKGNDKLKGGSDRDTLLGEGGNDKLSGSGDADTILAVGAVPRGDYVHNRSGGDDVTVAGTAGPGGRDVAKGGPGNDLVDTLDGENNDTANGNKGFDNCSTDPGDSVRSCETD